MMRRAKAVAVPAGAHDPAQTGAERRARVVLFGLFGSGNYGNDGSLEAMLGLLREAAPQADVLCVCDGPEAVRRSFGLNAIAMAPQVPARFGALVRRSLNLSLKPGNFARALAHLRGQDVMIVPGTGLIDDFMTGPLGIPLDLFTWCLAAKVLGVPVHFQNIGAGPLVRPSSRKLMLAAARMTAQRSYRDLPSLQFMAAHGFPATDGVGPDLAFALAAPSRKAAPFSKARVRIGLGVMDYDGWHRGTDGAATQRAYERKLAHLVQSLARCGHEVCLLPGDEGDLDAIQSLRAALPADLLRTGAIRATAARDLHDIMLQMSETDCVIATRFHNIVCALNTGTPVISLGYAGKNRALLAEAGCADFALHVDSFQVSEVLALLERVQGEHAAMTQRMAAFKAGTARRFDDLRALLARSLAAPDALLTPAPSQPCGAPPPQSAHSAF